MKENTVATNAALMDYLEDLMVSLGYDIQAFQRIVYRTDAYQREGSLEEPVPGAPYYFAGPILRRRSAEQIWDSLVAMTRTHPDAPDASGALAAEKRLAAVQLIAEAVYDQKPPQFLKNLQEVVKIQEQLSVEIEAAQAKVARAREAGDPGLIREAGRKARRDPVDDHDPGRAPEINSNEGRDHHPRAFTCVLAGGGIKGGIVHGKTDEEGSKVVEGAVKVQDFNATIAYALGLPLD